MNKPWIAVSAVALLASPGAYAASGVGEGDFEAGVSVTMVTVAIESDSGDFDADAGIVQLSGGKFFTDQLEAKAALSAILSPDDTLGTLLLGADYLFNSGSNVVPFAGAAFGLGVFDTETDYLDVHGGVKYFFRERVSLEGKLSFLSPTDSAYDSAIDLFAGLNFYF